MNPTADRVVDVPPRRRVVLLQRCIRTVTRCLFAPEASAVQLGVACARHTYVSETGAGVARCTWGRPFPWRMTPGRMILEVSRTVPYGQEAFLPRTIERHWLSRCAGSCQSMRIAIPGSVKPDSRSSPGTATCHRILVSVTKSVLPPNGKAMYCKKSAVIPALMVVEYHVGGGSMSQSARRPARAATVSGWPLPRVRSKPAIAFAMRL
jgi:hypothetical protein